MINYKTLLLIAALSLIVGYAFGRYSNRAATPAVQTQDTAKTKEDIVKDKKTVIVKEPDGKKTITITEETHTKTDQSVSSREKTSASSGIPVINISALAGIDFRTRAPVYGISASKEFIGPITLGAFGLTNGVIGVSVGLNF